MNHLWWWCMQCGPFFIQVFIVTTKGNWKAQIWPCSQVKRYRVEFQPYLVPHGGEFQLFVLRVVVGVFGDGRHSSQMLFPSGDETHRYLPINQILSEQYWINPCCVLFNRAKEWPLNFDAVYSSYLDPNPATPRVIQVQLHSMLLNFSDGLGGPFNR